VHGREVLALPGLFLFCFARKIIQVAPPARRVVSFSQATSFGGVQYLFYLAAYFVGSAGLGCPNRTQDLQDVIGLYGISRELANDGECIEFKLAQPAFTPFV
jgi:hypothetical protein